MNYRTYCLMVARARLDQVIQAKRDKATEAAFTRLFASTTLDALSSRYGDESEPGSDCAPTLRDPDACPPTSRCPESPKVKERKVQVSIAPSLAYLYREHDALVGALCMDHD